MDSSGEILDVLKEIRDTQNQHLREYQKSAARWLEIQEDAVKRQDAMATLHVRVLQVCGVLVFGAIILLLTIMFGHS